MQTEKLLFFPFFKVYIRVLVVVTQTQGSAVFVQCLCIFKLLNSFIYLLKRR